MTERLAQTMQRIANLQQLETVVTTMRGISASRTQQAHGLLQGLRAHAAVIGGAIGQALALVPEDQRPGADRSRQAVSILFCAEQGFAGAFSDRVLEALEPATAGVPYAAAGNDGPAAAVPEARPPTAPGGSDAEGSGGASGGAGSGGASGGAGSGGGSGGAGSGGAATDAAANNAAPGDLASGAATVHRDIFLIGTRGASLAAERGISLTWQSAMVPHASLIPALASRIADALYAWLSDHAGRRVDVVVPTWSAEAGIVIRRRSLLPFDFGRFAVPTSGQPPLITLPPPVLLARLAEEYVFAELCEAALTAFAAENEARVAAMLAAKGNLEHMRSDLQALQRQIRQEEITAEVVELASGASMRGEMR